MNADTLSSGIGIGKRKVVSEDLCFQNFNKTVDFKDNAKAIYTLQFHLADTFIQRDTHL